MTKRDALPARPLATRRGVLAGAAAAAPLVLLARPAIAQADRTRLLRYVPTANLTFTDPGPGRVWGSQGTNEADWCHWRQTRTSSGS